MARECATVMQLPNKQLDSLCLGNQLEHLPTCEHTILQSTLGGLPKHDSVQVTYLTQSGTLLALQPADGILRGDNRNYLGLESNYPLDLLEL